MDYMDYQQLVDNWDKGCKMFYIFAKWLLVLLVSTYIETAGSLVFQSTSCSSTESLIVRLYDVSFSTCAEECERRANCSLYNYRTGFHSCELLSKNGNETTEAKGCVVGLKPTMSVRKCKCSSKKDCDAAGGPGYKTECPPLSVPHAAVFGNVWTVGSKAAVVCYFDKSYHTTKCQENGTWTNVPSCPEAQECPSSNNDFQMFSGQQIKICSFQRKTQEEAAEACKRVHGQLVRIGMITSIQNSISEELKRHLQVHREARDVWVQGKFNKTDKTWRFDDDTEFETSGNLFRRFQHNSRNLACIKLRRKQFDIRRADCKDRKDYICMK